jgi:molybdopterin converting factor small subunit
MAENEVVIEFLGGQINITKTRYITMPVTPGTVAGDVFHFVQSRYPGIDLNRGGLFITVNHEMATPDKPLNPQDLVSFVPLIGGG